MTLLARLGTQLPKRYYLGVDVGYREYVAAVFSLQTFARGDDRWKQARYLHFSSTRAELRKLQRYLDGFCSDPIAFLGLCEPTGGLLRCHGVPVPARSRLPYVAGGKRDHTVHAEEDLPQHAEDGRDGCPSDGADRLPARGSEEFTLRPLELPDPNDADLLALRRDSWKLNTMICWARNQFAQLMALIFPELKTFFIHSVSTLAPVAPISLMAAYPPPAQLAVAPPEEVYAVLWKARAYQHARRVEELQELAGDSSGLLPDPGRAWWLKWLTEFLLWLPDPQVRQGKIILPDKWSYSR